LAASQYRPADARQLIGKRYDRDILMDAAEQTLRPSAKCGVLFRDIGQCRSCSMDQQLAQILVSSLADPHESWLAAGRRLPRNQAQPWRNRLIKTANVASGQPMRGSDIRTGELFCYVNLAECCLRRSAASAQADCEVAIARLSRRDADACPRDSRKSSTIGC
jgi:hypothetical protein